jgi:hypothetical protein
MMRRAFSAVAFVGLVLGAGCHHRTIESESLLITGVTIVADQLPAEFDATRTYHYREGSVTDPVLMLAALWHSGLESTRAWQPLDNICLDPVGPQFTVEFTRDDPRIIGQGFERGDGRLHCATTLTVYTVSPAGH